MIRFTVPGKPLGKGRPYQDDLDARTVACTERRVVARNQNLAGIKIGRLTVLKRQPGSKWLCLCECGGKKSFNTGYLNVARRDGRVISCGCARSEWARELGKTHKKYDFDTRKLKNVRSAMISRCTRPHNKDYPRYGARGISICAEWLDSPSAFYDWAVSAGWRPGLSIERIDSDGNYCPENCTFIPISRQAANICRNRLVEYGGATKTVADWSRATGIGYRTLLARLNRGWPAEMALRP